MSTFAAGKADTPHSDARMSAFDQSEPVALMKAYFWKGNKHGATL
jgi:hypothetical protein